MGNKSGFAIIAAIIIMAILASLGVFAVSLLSTDTEIALDTLKSTQALFIADTGLQHVKYKLKNDEAYRDAGYTVPETASIGEGSFTVTVTLATDVYTLVSTGTVGNVKRQITESLYVTSGVLSRGIHADGSTLDFDGTSGVINANVSCHVALKNVGPSLTVNGTLTESYPKVNPSITYLYYENLARDAGQYSTNNLTFANGTYTGVWYTTKSVTIGDNTTVNGAIFAEGDVDFTNSANNVTLQQTNNYPILVTQSNISSSDTGPPASRVGLQNSTINGLILAGSNITFDYINNTTFNGTILADNNVTMKNGTNLTINYDIDIFIPPPQTFLHTDEGGASTAISQNDWHETSSGS